MLTQAMPGLGLVNGGCWPWHMYGCQQGCWSGALVDDVQSLVERLPDLLPPQVPVLCHGDLWSGNVIATGNGMAVLDPAAAHGPAEADLAMMILFGGFPEVFYRTTNSTEQPWLRGGVNALTFINCFI